MKINLIYVVTLFSVFRLYGQAPNVDNWKNVFTWTNGCNDPRACCKLIKGGEKCADLDYSPNVRCGGQVITNCIECTDLEEGVYHMGDYTLNTINCSIDCIKLSTEVKATHLGISKTIFNFSNYTISDSGLAFWYNVKSTTNILTMYKATSRVDSPFYQVGTLDSIKIDLDTLFGYSSIPDDKLDLIKTKWLNEKLTIVIAPNPTSGHFTIVTESKHPALSSTQDLILEIFSASGQLINSQKIFANGKYMFEVPPEYPSSFLVYRIKWDNSFYSGLISVIRQE